MASISDRLYKVVILGDASVGKTSLIETFVKGFFPGSYKVSIGCDFQVCSVSIPDPRLQRRQSLRLGQPDARLIAQRCGASAPAPRENEAPPLPLIDVRLQVWDTAGAERFMTSLMPMLMRGVDVVVLCFDLSDLSTIDGVLTWYAAAEEAVSHGNRGGSRASPQRSGSASRRSSSPTRATADVDGAAFGAGGGGGGGEGGTGLFDGGGVPILSPIIRRIRRGSTAPDTMADGASRRGSVASQVSVRGRGGSVRGSRRGGDGLLGVPVVLVGLKSDSAVHPPTHAHTISHAHAGHGVWASGGGGVVGGGGDGLPPTEQHLNGPNEGATAGGGGDGTASRGQAALRAWVGERTADRLSSLMRSDVPFVAVSAMQNEGVAEVFEEVARVAVQCAPLRSSSTADYVQLAAGGVGGAMQTKRCGCGSR